MKPIICLLLTSVSLVLFQSNSECQAVQFQDLKWIDLTYPFSEKTLYWPNNPKGFTRDTLFEGQTDKGFYYSSYSYYAPEHGGTHLDAPVHFAEGKKTVDQVSLDQLTGNAVVIDVSSRALLNRDYLIEVEDVLNWEDVNGPIAANTIILFRTGYGLFYPDALTYFGTSLKGEEAIPLLHFPGVSAELALFLTKSRKVKATGIDTPSIDYGQSSDFKAHRILLKENIPVFENVAHLDQLPVKNIYIIALPMLLEKGSGAPLRIMAGIAKN
jgi:kynurenine formamidase